MKKVVVKVFVFFLILSFVFQPSSALASSSAKTIEPELEVLANSHVLSEPQFLETLEHRNGSVDLLDDLLMELELSEEVRADIPEQTEPVEKPEYVSPTPEVVAQTQAQVEAYNCGSVTDVPQIECEALVALYNSTNGAGWDYNANWLESLTVGDWSDVTVENSHVVGLQLDSLGLNGTIPTEIGNLLSLNYLDLDSNFLEGGIPNSIGNLTNLISLDLSCNQLTSIIPQQLGNLTNLQEFMLYDNQLSGSIPPELGNLSNLRWLNFYNNQLSGLIPSELGNLRYLRSLVLGHNNLSGNIPSQLGTLNVFEIDLTNNQLTGTIPTSFENMMDLRYLHLQNNLIMGEIPPNLGSRYSTQHINLSSNQLSGSIPAELAKITSLMTLDLSSNQLTGSIPISFINLTNLTSFYFNETYLCEPNTPEFLAWKATVYTWSGTGIVCEGSVAPSWLLMFYFAGDNNLDKIYQTEIAMINQYRNSNVDIAVFYDSASLDTSYRFFPASGGLEYSFKGNLNSGDGQTLVNFMNWAQGKTNAQKQALIIGDHGHGLSGVAEDNRGDDQITPNELRQSLTLAGVVDVLFLSVCLSANLEFMWEIRDLTDYYVASESIAQGPMLIFDFIQKIKQTTTADELAVNMARAYYYSFHDVKYVPSTISVVDMSHIYQMFDRTNNLAMAIKLAPPATKLSIWGILDYTRVQRFDEGILPGIDNFDRFADLFHFASLVDYFSELSPAAQALLSTESDFVLYNRAWSGKTPKGVTWNHDKSRGVSITLPLNPMSFYDGEWLDFARGADWSFTAPTVQPSIQVEGYNWGPMVSELIAQYNPEGADEPFPPDPVSLLVSYEIYLPMLTR